MKTFSVYKHPTQIIIMMFKEKHVTSARSISQSSFSRLYAISMLLASLMICSPIFASDKYYQKPCTIQANDAKTFTELRDKGYSMATLRHHIATTRPTDDQDALLNVLAHIFTTFKTKDPGDVFEAALFSCENHGQTKAFGPAATPSLSEPRGYLTDQERGACEMSRTELQDMVNRLTYYERRLDQMQVVVNASYTRLQGLGGNPPEAMTDEHNKLVSTSGQLSTQYTALSAEYNKSTDRYNSLCAGKAVR